MGAALIMQVQRALALHQQGKLPEAEELYRTVLRSNPNQVECLHYLGVIMHQMGRNAEAVELIQKAIKLNRSQPAAHSNLGLALHALGEYQLALDSYDRALALDRHYACALNNRGNVFRDLGRFDDALKSYDAAIATQANYLEAHNNRYVTLRRMGRFDEALISCDKAITLKPTAGFYSDRGCLLRELFRFDEALKSFEKATAMQPDFLDAWSNKGTLLSLTGKRQEAVDAFEQCIKIDPASAYFRLKRLIARVPVIRERQDDVATIRRNFSEDVAALGMWLDGNPTLNPREVDIFGADWPFYLAYHEENNRELIAPFGTIYSRLMVRWTDANGILPGPGRDIAASKMRVGIVSAHIADHPVWTAIVKGWFQEFDPAQFELHVFCLGTQKDAQTSLAKARAASFHSGDRSVLEWAKLIVQSESDVLIYPELGMDSLTPKLAAMRLAPKQITTWGHPETTGLPTMDAYVSAAGFEDAEAQACYSERLIRLPNLGCYYDPDETAVTEVDLAAWGVRPDAPLFVCPGSPYKYSPEHDHVFVEIAKRLVDAQLLFFTNPNVPLWCDLFQQRLASAFRDAGLDPSRYLVVIPWQLRPQFYSIMRQADVFLDTIGFSGFNTAMQAIDCGLPIVTVEGKFMRGRFASAILKRIGLDELVHLNDATYCDCAVRLATDKNYRNSVQSTLLANRSVLYRDKEPIPALETALKALCAEPGV
ncbi:MAG: tetratricopeptide repeat protein [Burkholderiales bacterium]